MFIEIVNKTKANIWIDKWFNIVEYSKQRSKLLKAGYTITIKYECCPIMRRYFACYTQAGERRKQFTVSFEEFKSVLLSGYCVYCGDTDAHSIDRIDNAKGYAPGNIQLVCGTCNRMKYTHSPEWFLSHVTKIVRYRLLRK